ncbi:MFS transporter [Asanoa sp. WMMD1127]|uniref:MFS transporter n=1 Tax=Asanoa sp. WMMD1127 TaxID=3016107 RepID=UPI00241745F6|nr:MFS transporter [Asanoa sp. WMMD1127]MDG4825952.1 MFS transporter [Asanoa sp. WMMD1127]
MVRSAYAAFAVFGAFWGVWGASVPRVQRQAGVDAGELGVALLFVGAGALPAMLLVGRALDRWGLRVAPLTIGALGVAGAGLALTARSLPALCVGLALVGATSGAADVAENAVAGRAEKVADRPVITRAHGMFSLHVVLGSLATGLVSAAGWPLAVPFVVVAVLSVAVGVAMVRDLPAGAAPRAPAAARSAGGWRVAPFVLVGVLGSLAFASENAHQSWSAVFATDELGAGGGLSAVPPAVFAGTVAITRFAAGGLGVDHARAILLTGATVAAAGALVIAVAPTLLVAGVGLALAAVGTAVLFPTLVGVASRDVDEAHRGRAISVVTAVSYLGFVVGPVYVGLWADATGLRGAMVAVAALAVALFVLAPPLLRTSGLAVRVPPAPNWVGKTADPE